MLAPVESLEILRGSNARQLKMFRKHFEPKQSIDVKRIWVDALRFTASGGKKVQKKPCHHLDGTALIEFIIGLLTPPIFSPW